MTEVQYAFTHFLRMFVVIAVITAGYGYLIISVVMTRKRAFILQFLSLAGLGALFSFLVFRSDSMWSGAPEVSLAILIGMFTATVIFYVFFLLIRAVGRLIPQ
ncbi:MULTISPECIES: hypothetical protein [unclassified Enterobacter]|uniref:hypothetical protein n=1 Tax=Enterobacter TaxID=547 RepID=UPI002A82D5EE|nr:MULTISPECIES: hypothetical protein [unclassified Enterobacter]